MASGCPPPFGDPGEMREGFLCPLCLKDLQSFYQLQSHYEEEHSSEERDVKGQLKNLVQKAKRAKKKLLKREGDDRTDSGSQERYESFSYGGVDPYMWEPQEVGAMRSHLSDFKKHRAARIDHYVVEVNKLIIRLEKLTSFDRANTESAKIRAIEKSVVPWVSDQDVPFCPDCGNKFSIRNRRHHCRLCGSIMCKKCMELVSLPLASKLTSASKEALGSHTSPNSSPNSVHGSRRGSISSISSVSSVLDEKDDDRIRCCRHCKDTLLKREQQIDEKEYTPDIVKLYEKLRLCMEKVDQKAPEYIRMAESLNRFPVRRHCHTLTCHLCKKEVQGYNSCVNEPLRNSCSRVLLPSAGRYGFPVAQAAKDRFNASYLFLGKASHLHLTIVLNLAGLPCAAVDKQHSHITLLCIISCGSILSLVYLNLSSYICERW